MKMDGCWQEEHLVVVTMPKMQCDADFNRESSLVTHDREAPDS